MEKTYKGFGVPETTLPHCFRITIPAGRGGMVEIVEDFGVSGDAVGLRSICRARLPRPVWRSVADEVKAYLNRRLKEKGLKGSSFKPGVDTLVDRLLGREITVLAWAIETHDAETAASCVPKWAAYRPEELWWIFAQIDRDAGEFDDPHTGWRAGITSLLLPAQAPAVARSRKRRKVAHIDGAPDLFSWIQETA